MAPDRQVKTALNEQFARIGRCLSAPRRLELIDVLAQGERNVEQLADETQMSIGLVSAHLQRLRRGGLVETRRDRSHIFYRLAGDDVYHLLTSLRAVARSRLADVQRLAASSPANAEGREAVSRDDLIARVRSGAVTVVDVRPHVEYWAGHIPNALSIPIDELEARMGELARDIEVVAYCRGPFCLYAPTAVSALRRRGFRAFRLEDGFPEWRMAGLPVATGSLVSAAPWS